MIRNILAFITLFCVVSVQPLDAQDGPEGSAPFAIIHYGCHGASYMAKPSDYDAPCRVMERADSLGVLTPFGQDVVGRLRLIRQDARNHWGELSEQGIREQQEVAWRLMARFPGVLNKDCSYIGARSLRNTRSMLSMEQLLVEISKVCRIRVYHNASNAYSSYLSSLDEGQLAVRKDSTAKAAYEAFSERYNDGDRLAKTLFTDSDFIHSQVDIQTLNDQLFNIADNIRQTGKEGKVTLYDLFTADEICHQRKRQNVWNNLNFGRKARIPFIHQLMRHLIHCTDTAQTFKHSAVFHIADETSFLPLVSLLGIDLPLGSSKNLQFILYRKNPEDQDVWIKVLLNEQEVSLPLPSEHAPYYRLKDFQDYYLEKVKE